MIYAPQSARSAAPAAARPGWWSRAPHPALAAHVGCYWALEAHAATRVHLMADGCVDLTFEPTSDGLAARVSRPHERSAWHDVPAGFSLFGVRFQPGGAAALLGLEVGELPATWLDTEACLGGSVRALAAHMTEVPAGARVELVERWLLDRLAARRVDVRLQTALGAILAAEGAAPVSALLSRRAPLRTLDRIFARYVGLTPKRLSRIVRFQRALGTLARGGPRDGWAAFAAAHGYADQAHLVRDLRELAGEAPVSLLRSLRG